MVANPPAGFPAEMLVGFSFAAAVAFTWIAVQRDRFIKLFYFWGQPPYKRPVKIGFQVIFLLWAAGTVWQLVDKVIKLRAVLQWKQAVIDSLIWSAIVVVMLHTAEWDARRRAAKRQELKAKS